MKPAPIGLSRRAFVAMLPSAGLLSGASTKLSDDEQEKFLKEARVVSTKGAGVGITGSRRATLNDGTLTHDAHIQVVDEAKAVFQGTGGTEMNFRDTWKFNIAAYRLDRLLGLKMIPVSVERRFEGRPASFTWWVDDVLMMEVDRFRKKIKAPDAERWNCQMHVVRIFDQLICNVDRNLQNLLITKDWDLWMIDHTRAFRLHKKVNAPKNIERCDRKLLARLKELDRAVLRENLLPYVTPMEIDGLLGRRDHIIQLLEANIQKKGENQVLYDRT
jgi:hypothetical protein